MDAFSWTDGIRATVSTCIPCFTGRGAQSDSEGENEGRRGQQGVQTRYEELEGLLGDVEDTDADAETMSLHSNIGDPQRRRKKKKRTHKSIRIFGFDLFGRPPIQLSDSEDESHSRHRRPNRLAIGQLASAHSSSSASAFDSDASPLDAQAISQLTVQDAAARAAVLREAEEARLREEKAEKEERRRRRRERKDLKRVAAALANGAGMNMDGEQFEGFQGSGEHAPVPFSPGSVSSMTSPTPSAPVDEFGPYVGGFLPTLQSGGDYLVDGEEEADFGGEVYTRKTRSRGSDGSRSHSQSQTSASRSNADSSSHYFNHHHLSQTQLQVSPLPSPAFHTKSMDTSLQKPKRKKMRSATSASGSTSKKSSNSPTSQSASLPSLDSPVSPNFKNRFAPSEPFIVETPTSFPGVIEDASKGALALDEPNFPSVGFGGVRRMNSAGSGAFLARRGDD